MTNRKLREAGIHPFIAYVLGLVILILISEYAFQKTEFAKYLVILISLSFLFRLSEQNRTDFLLATFGELQHKKIRIIENVIVSTPFIAILIFKSAIIEAVVLFGLALVFALFSFKANFNFTLLTPFSKRPFEFTTGFRKSFYLFPAVYALTIIAISVDNLNLGIFSIVLVFLISSSYYLKPENEYYVWVFADSARTFIFKKLKLAAIHTFILNTPIVLALLTFYANEFVLILLIYIIGLCFLWTIILAKYSAYPREINILEGSLIAFSIYFPPFLAAIGPYFYIKSINKLKAILHDNT